MNIIEASARKTMNIVKTSTTIIVTSKNKHSYNYNNYYMHGEEKDHEHHYDKLADLEVDLHAPCHLVNLLIIHNVVTMTDSFCSQF